MSTHCIYTFRPKSRGSVVLRTTASKNLKPSFRLIPPVTQIPSPPDLQIRIMAVGVPFSTCKRPAFPPQLVMDLINLLAKLLRSLPFASPPKSKVRSVSSLHLHLKKKENIILLSKSHLTSSSSLIPKITKNGKSGMNRQEVNSFLTVLILLVVFTMSITFVLSFLGCVLLMYNLLKPLKI